MVCIVYEVAWRKGQVGWVLGGSHGSVWVMGEWVSGYLDSGCHELSERNGLYGLKYHIVDIRT